MNHQAPFTVCWGAEVFLLRKAFYVVFGIIALLIGLGCAAYSVYALFVPELSVDPFLAFFGVTLPWFGQRWLHRTNKPPRPRQIKIAYPKKRLTLDDIYDRLGL